MACRRKSKINWKSVDGAFERPKRLHLVEGSNKLYYCPVSFCDHEGFQSKRGCRKHVKAKHGWYFYFESKPDIKAIEESRPASQATEKASERCTTQDIPSFSKTIPLAVNFVNWLQSTAGGGKTKSHSEQVVSRVLKFLKAMSEDVEDEEMNSTAADYCIGSVECIQNFVNLMETDWKLSHSGQLGYLNAVYDFLDYRKSTGVSSVILANFSLSEIYLKRAKQCISKRMKVQWNNELNIETLESKGRWATLKEMQEVIPFHLNRYKAILDKCKMNGLSVTSTELTFATRFMTVFLFLHVKGTRPMTYLFLTVPMFTDAKKKNGFIDQKKFKTAATYGFDSLTLDKNAIKIVEDYITYVRPLIHPKCDFILINKNGNQLSKLSDTMGKLVFEAIGKYIHPTRYRQIIETESSELLDSTEQQWVSEDQKHSSNVAKLHYRKKRSRDVALKGQHCLKKLKGEDGEKVEESLKLLISESESNSEYDDIFLTQNKFRDTDLEDSSQSTPEILKSDTDNLKNKKLNSSEDQTIKFPIKSYRFFTPEEDNNLKKGIEKHGYGHWSAMLKDNSLKFHKGRTADAMKKRADRTFSRKSKN